ncbi:MAG: amidohydrolase family protein [bacterium]
MKWRKNKAGKYVWICSIIILSGFISYCTDTDKFYNREDFKTFEKIDAHMHVRTDDPAWLEQAKQDNFRLFSLNTDVPNFVGLPEQQEIVLRLKKKYGDRINYATSFSMEGFNEPHWQEKTLDYLKDSFKKGALAVKVWKNIGMTVKDEEGNFVMIDDSRFDPIFSYLAEHNIPLFGHIGEPKNCWLPLEKMTVKSDQAYFKMHPEYHMYKHPEYPSYQEIIDARDAMLRKNPDLKFIGCHLASLEWSVDELAERFDEFPNLAVDLAERICHLQVQSQQDRDKVRGFIIKYQDRILYGSDFGSGLSVSGVDDIDVLMEHMHKRWVEAWRYFATDDIMTAPELDGEFKGLKLSKNVVEKIFRYNAEKWIPGL